MKEERKFHVVVFGSKNSPIRSSCEVEISTGVDIFSIYIFFLAFLKVFHKILTPTMWTTAFLIVFKRYPFLSILLNFNPCFLIQGIGSLEKPS